MVKDTDPVSPNLAAAYRHFRTTKLENKRAKKENKKLKNEREADHRCNDPVQSQPKSEF